MCTRYVSPEEATIDRAWRIDRRTPWRGGGETYIHDQAPFIRAERHRAEPARELAVGQWSLIPQFEEQSKPAFSTYNARFEDIRRKPSFAPSWADGRRCIVPAAAYYEPCWESGEHVPWKFTRADGALWALAGLWNTWHDREHDTYLESFTMLTINADGHPLMSRMHRPDLKRPPDKQDKRMVVPIEAADLDLWLFGRVEAATQLIRMAPVEIFIGEPQPVERKTSQKRGRSRVSVVNNPDQGSLF